tara:strand:- start:320 stop:1207 length:888 start_codon:yes stop_codon:yes gene_type:complete
MKSQIKYILIFFCGFIVAQGNFQILTIPANTRMLSLSNAGHAMNSLSSSTHNVASLNTDNRLNINFNSHIYPASILYFNTEARIPLQNFICSFNYANLNYGEFKDAESNYSFNSSEFLFKGMIKTELGKKVSFGASFNYAINKIADQFSHAMLLSLGIRTQLDNPKFGLGLAINNIGKILDNTYSINENLPTSFNLSTFYCPKNFPGFLLLDIVQFTNVDKIQIHLGLEIKIGDYLLVRFGNSNNALDLYDADSSYFPGLSGGLGIISKKWNIDVGFFNLESAGIVSSLSIIHKI